MYDRPAVVKKLLKIINAKEPFNLFISSANLKTTFHQSQNRHFKSLYKLIKVSICDDEYQLDLFRRYFTAFVNQTIMHYTLNLHSDVSVHFFFSIKSPISKIGMHLKIRWYLKGNVIL